MDKKTLYGGQAVIEGVMMLGPKKMAIAVRKPDQTITVDVRPRNTYRDRWPVLKAPLVRGVVNLIESLTLGIRALTYSANQAMEGEEEEIGRGEMALTLLVSFVFAIGLFVVIPTWAVKFVHRANFAPFALNLVEGIIRIIIFLLYVYAISQMKDIQRVFAYHGAEHKTLHAYEAGLPLTVENIRRYTTLHPRCGTNFLLIVMLVSVFLFAFLGWPNLFYRIISRIILLPVVAGVSYEILRWGGTSGSPLVKVCMGPGLWLQKLTTREPDAGQIEVAIKALEGALEEPK